MPASRDALLARICDAQSRLDTLVGPDPALGATGATQIARHALKEARAWLDFPAPSTLKIAESLIDLAINELSALERHTTA